MVGTKEQNIDELRSLPRKALHGLAMAAGVCLGRFVGNHFASSSLTPSSAGLLFGAICGLSALAGYLFSVFTAKKIDETTISKAIKRLIFLCFILLYFAIIGITQPTK